MNENGWNPLPLNNNGQATAARLVRKQMVLCAQTIKEEMRNVAYLKRLGYPAREFGALLVAQQKNYTHMHERLAELITTEGMDNYIVSTSS